MSSFFNEIEIFESSKSAFNCSKNTFPTYEQFLPFTDLTVSLTNDAIERDLGRIDMFTACDFLLKRELSPEAMLTALMYIKRFKKRKEVNNTRLSSFTSADLFLISMMLASKYLFDDGTEENVVNEEWAEDFGKENMEINALEIDFLNAMDWRLHVELSEFLELKQKICVYLATTCWNSHLIHGSTYRELIIIHHNMNDNDKNVLAFIEMICKVKTVEVKGMYENVVLILSNNNLLYTIYMTNLHLYVKYGGKIKPFVIAGCVVAYMSIIVGVHVMAFVIHSRPTLSNHQWNSILDHHISSLPAFSLNITKDKFTDYNDINESQSHHSTITYSFLSRSKLLTEEIEQ